MTPDGTSWPATGPLVAGIVTAAFLVAGLGAWSASMTISGAIIAFGQVEVAGSRQVVAHPDGGVVVEVLAAEGARVTKGDVLLRLDGSDLRAELAHVLARLAELQTREARLVALGEALMTGDFPPHSDLDPALDAGQARLLALQAETVTQARTSAETRIHQIESQMSGLDAQAAALQTQVALVEADLRTEVQLQAQGLTLANRRSALERELAVLRGQIGALVAARAEAAGRITGVRQELSALVTGMRQDAEAELRDLAASQLDLGARRDALLARIARLEVRAPATGTVLDLRVTRPMAVIRPAEVLLTIVPVDRPLRIILRVPVSGMDEVAAGQVVRLVFPSLPVGSAADIAGTVALISADAVTDDRTGQPFFRAEIVPDAQDLRIGSIWLRPGMPVEGFIRTTDRSPLAYLLDPVTIYFNRAFRDG